MEGSLGWQEGELSRQGIFGARTNESCPIQLAVGCVLCIPQRLLKLPQATLGFPTGGIGERRFSH